MFSFLNLFLFFSLLQQQQQQVKTESIDTACASDSSNAPSDSYKLTVLKNDSCACVVVHEEIDTTTICFKIMNGAAVFQCTASGASLSMDTVLSINNVSNVNTTFTAATCKTKSVPLLLPVSTSLYFFHYLLKTGPDVKPNI